MGSRPIHGIICESARGASARCAAIRPSAAKRARREIVGATGSAGPLRRGGSARSTRGRVRKITPAGRGKPVKPRPADTDNLTP